VCCSERSTSKPRPTLPAVSLKRVLVLMTSSRRHAQLRTCSSWRLAFSGSKCVTSQRCWINKCHPWFNTVNRTAQHQPAKSIIYHASQTIPAFTHTIVPLDSVIRRSTSPTEFPSYPNAACKPLSLRSRTSTTLTLHDRSLRILPKSGKNIRHVSQLRTIPRLQRNTCILDWKLFQCYANRGLVVSNQHFICSNMRTTLSISNLVSGDTCMSPLNGTMRMNPSLNSKPVLQGVNATGNFMISVSKERNLNL
jgi:hypothetical protein